MRFSYQTEQWLPHPLPLVFEFFANPANLPRLMPPWQKAHIDWSSYRMPPPRPRDRSQFRSEIAGAGSRITLSFRPIPILPSRIEWQAEIAEFEWDDRFCDLQLKGPFAFWKHCHYFRAVTEDTGDGPRLGAKVIDHVEYELPFGAIGSIAHRLFLRGQIKRTFAWRHSRLAQLLVETPIKSSP